MAAPSKNKSDVLPTDELLMAIERAATALDEAFGGGTGTENPALVVAFMQAMATQNLAAEVNGVRELLASGSAGLTVAVEHGA